MIRRIKAYLSRRKINRIKKAIKENNLIYRTTDLPEELYKKRRHELIQQLNQEVDKWGALTSNYKY